MSMLRHNFSKLKIHDSDHKHNASSTKSRHSSHSPSPSVSPSHQGESENETFTQPTPVTSPSLHDNGSTTSIGSSQPSSRPPSIKVAHANESTSSLRKPAPSFLELKRFFGKGRKKHEHGVSHAAEHAERQAERKPMFSLFGDRHEHEHEHVHEHEKHDKHEKHDHENSFLGLTSFRKKKPKEKKSKEHTAGATGEFIDANSGLKVKVKGKPPADLDPNFVVHAPDYEAEWDPFHLFDEDNIAEDRLPFLESRITKYGEMGKNVGSGAGGSVSTMERPSDHKIFAVKEFRARRSTETPQKYAKHVAAEYALGAALHNEHIIETIDLIKEGEKYYEVMEYGPHDFFELVMSGTMNTAQVNSSFAQILKGVAYLHSLGVAHRDLKLDNCVVTDSGIVKIIDFGSSVVFKYPISPQIHLARGIMGSDPYLAPEVFYRHPYQPQCADVWSCGIIYACAYMRRFPWRLPQKEDNSFRKFSANTTNITGQPGDKENPKKIQGPWRLLRLLPSESRDLILKMLTIEVKDRITMEQVMEDPWYKSIEIISVLPNASIK